MTVWLALPRPGVWLDEAATVSATSRSWSEMMRLVSHQDASLSGYYAAVWGVSRTLHLAPLTAGRLVSGLAYVVATALVALIARRLMTRRVGGRRWASLAGCVFALLPSMSASAVNARPEALATCLVAATFLSALTGRRVTQAVCGLLACWVYALDVLYLPLALLLTMAAATERPEPSRTTYPEPSRTTYADDGSAVVEPSGATRANTGSPVPAPSTTSSSTSELTGTERSTGASESLATRCTSSPLPGWRTAALSSIVGAAWLVLCSRQQTQVGWIHTSVPADLLAALTRVGCTAPLSRAHEQPALACTMALGVAAAAVAAGMSLRHRRSRTARTAQLLWLVAIVPPLVATAAVAAGKDIFVARYFTPSSIGIALVIGLAGRRLALRSRTAATILATACIAVSVPALWSSHLPDGHWGENLDAHHVALDLAAAGPHGDGASATNSTPTNATPKSSNPDSPSVWFVAPRNRATLFAPGRLDPRWQDADWWAQARASGTLWGPAEARPDLTRTAGTVVIVDTRQLSRLQVPVGCTRRIIATEARATSVLVDCALPHRK